MLQGMLACAFLLVTQPVVAYENLFATKGYHFTTTLNKHSFFQGQPDVEFSVSLDEMPDLPSWLKFQQDTSLEDAVLYGRLT